MTAAPEASLPSGAGKSATPDRDYVRTSGTLTFVNGGASEQTFPLLTLDDTKWGAEETVIVRNSLPHLAVL